MTNRKMYSSIGISGTDLLQNFLVIAEYCITLSTPAAMNLPSSAQFSGTSGSRDGLLFLTLTPSTSSAPPVPKQKPVSRDALASLGVLALLADPSTG